MDDQLFSRVLAQYRTLRRHATARNALEVLAIVFLLASFAFWSVAYWQLLSPPALLSLQSVQVVVLALVFSLAAPVLWTALIPTTPAGQLLQKTQTRTAGFAVTVGAAIYLSYVAVRLLLQWLNSQPGVAENDLARFLAVALALAFILIPALAWTQVAPERWLAQIQQAHQVKRLELLQSGELALIRVKLLRAKQLAAAGWANLSPREEREIVETQRALFLSIADSQRAIAGTLRDAIGFDADFGIMSDAQVNDAMDYVAQQLEAKRIELPAYAEPDETITPITGARGSLVAAVPAIPRPAPAPAASAANRSESLRFAAELAGARRKLAGTWTARQLGETLGKSERSARERIQEWESAGLVARDADGANSWYFTESGVHNGDATYPAPRRVRQDRTIGRGAQTGRPAAAG